jgi:hypothetical protein
MKDMKWVKGRRPKKDGNYLVYIPYPDPKNPIKLYVRWEASDGWSGLPQGLVPEITDYLDVISPKEQRKRGKRKK